MAIQRYLILVACVFLICRALLVSLFDGIIHNLF